jgi:alkylhydroperoxidase family enzyme
VEGIKEDYTRLDVTPAEQAMLAYAVKLTVAPSSVGLEEV